MSKTLRNMGLAAIFAVSASAFMSGQSSALTMAECSTQYRAAKAAGTLGSMKWNDFRKSRCSIAAAPGAAAATPAPAPAPAIAAAPATTPSGSFMKECSAAWKSLKAANTIPTGMKFKDFVASKCKLAGAPAAAPGAAATAPAVAAPAAKSGEPLGLGRKAVAPPEPSSTPDTTPLATTDKNGKAFTPGQMGTHQRMRTCGEQWRTLKAQGKAPAGMAWPQYWSSCNTQLKATGQ